MKHCAPPSSGFGIYIHWPYCESKCPYCDFNSHVSAAVDQEIWLNAYVNELRRSYADAPDAVVHSVFFGGGTPSLMKPELVAGILDEIRRLWRFKNDPEVTLEANPGSVERSRFAGYRAAGVNRVSLGIQALESQALARLGRRHSVSDALTAIEVAKETFDRVSIDLIYARQDQTLAEWESELEAALALGTDHISLYQLTIEDGTAFARLYELGKLSGLPNEDLGADMYLATIERCAKNGLHNYEVSNFAKPDAESRHNLNYWRGGSYIGIGPGAHGRVNVSGNRYSTECHRDPKLWLETIAKLGSAESSRIQLTGPEILDEFLLMGLRLREGVCKTRAQELGFSSTHEKRLLELCDMGLMTRDAGKITTTHQGQLLLNSVLGHLTNPR